MTVDAKGANGHVHWIVATLRGKFDDDTLTAEYDESITLGGRF